MLTPLRCESFRNSVYLDNLTFDSEVPRGRSSPAINMSVFKNTGFFCEFAEKGFANSELDWICALFPANLDEAMCEIPNTKQTNYMYMCIFKCKCPFGEFSVQL